MQTRLLQILESWHFVRDVFAVESNADFARLSAQTRLDVLLADISICDGNGIDSVRLMKKAHPNGISIMISSNSKPDVIIEAIRAGAIGYMYKEDSQIEIIQAIRAGLKNEAPISPSIAYTILKSLQQHDLQSSDTSEKRKTSLLSNRESEIIQLIAKGMSNDEVGQVLGLSKNTVPVHIRNIYRKLGTTRRTEAVFEARQRGIIE